MVSWAAWVSSAGLGLDIIGVILLLIYGLSPDIRETGGLTIEWPGGKSNEEAKEEYRHYKRMSGIALGFLVVGFVLQIISNFLN